MRGRKMKAKKYVETKMIGEYQIVINHIIEIKDIELSELEYFYNDWDDPEEAYMKGIARDFYDDILWIDIDRFIDTLSEEYEQLAKEDLIGYEDRLKRIKKLKRKLNRYKGYNIDPKMK